MEAGRHTRSLSWVWALSLGCFVLAGLTGALYRFGIAHGVTFDLSLGNIRHAHSHLMYFGWVTPLLMALIWLHASGERHRRSVQVVLASIFAAAALAYPLFLAFGYSPVALGDAQMPLAVIAASLNMVLWYGFVALYVRVRPELPASTARTCWDAALVFLVAATGGAWGLAVLQPLGVESAMWSSALTHVFLDLFSEGWFVLGVLGLAYAELEPVEGGAPRWSLRLICAGVPLTFALGMPSALVPPPARLLASVGGTAVGVGLLLSAWVLVRALLMHGGGRRWWWGVPLSLLVVKAVAELGVSALPGAWWTGLQGLRIFYLHVMLLGFVSLGLVASAGRTWGYRAVGDARWFYTAVGILLASLLPMTTLWPGGTGRWAFVAAAWIALLPVVAAVPILRRAVRKRQTIAG